jgi:tRNA (adenine37-N6)-methyltransferase
MSTNSIVVSPVGYISLQKDGFVIKMDAPYRPALEGLQGFSHINVLWWSHFLDTPEYRTQTQCEQPYRHAPARLGIYATRSPMRPNPICLSIAPVIRVDVQAGCIYVAYIDAEDGTPVLDIKPYEPCADRVRQVEVPAWSRHWPDCYEDSASFDWQAEFVNAR